MKTTGTILILLSLFGIGFWIWQGIRANYQWDNTAQSYWNLSDKASTISAKADFIDKFVAALKSSDLADNDALIYKTADNNCENNIQAVSTLKQRLDQIKGMNESSFEYQQAIQQITAQEQGEAEKLLTTLQGCWYKTHHYFLWNDWLFVLYAFLILAGFVVGGVLLMD